MWLVAQVVLALAVLGPRAACAWQRAPEHKHTEEAVISQMALQAAPENVLRDGAGGCAGACRNAAETMRCPGVRAELARLTEGERETLTADAGTTGCWCLRAWPLNSPCRMGARPP
jgi:hypothetical protein